MRPYYYLGNNRGLTKLASGEPFFVNTRDQGITTWIILGGTWENFVDSILCGITRAGDRVLDAGANQGYYTVKLGSIVGPQGRVVAFEPNPELYEVLEANVDINGFRPRCQTFRLALGDEPGTADMRFPVRNMGGGSISPQLAHGEETVTVDIVRGDDVLPADTVFDVMKFDVEGFEPEAAKGLSAIMERSAHAAIVLEISPPAWRHGEDFYAKLARFTGKGRAAFEIDHEGWLTRLDFNDPACRAAIAARNHHYYVVLVPKDHWAISFISGRLRRTVTDQPVKAGL